MAKEIKKTTSISITLPIQAVEKIDELIEIGLYGTSRAEIARQLILDYLKKLREGGG